MRHFIVVYQFGKVASTSLVATLNALPDVKAVQAHFLGEKNLREMVGMITDPETSDYFHQHEVGQFVENARVTRAINAYRMGRQTDSLLAIISVSRDPFDWFRSSIVQDLVGYLPILHALPAEGRQEDADDDERTRRALEWMLLRFSETARELGGLDRIAADRIVRNRLLPEHPLLAANKGLLAIFYMMLRPFSWFDAHYREAIGYGLADLEEIEQAVLFRDVGWASLFVLRYEDLEEHAKIAARRLGIGKIDSLLRENLSGGKDGAAAVRQAFESEPAAALRSQFEATEYARRFGYA